MKITRLETLFVKPRWVFLKVHTDAGIVGLGEPIVEGQSKATAAAVHDMGRYLIGQDPFRIEHHWQAIYRGAFYRGGPVLTSALSGIEQALWDIKGKALGVPAYELLGGAVRDRIRLYRGVNRVRMYAGGEEDIPAEYAEGARALVAEGFTALKTSIPKAVQIVDKPSRIDEFIAPFAAMREAIGNDVDMAIDFHGRVSPAMAVRLCQALEPHRPLFVEEPCLPENVDTMVTIARSTTIPIATGERLFTKWGFREVLEKQAACIVQPDLSHAGGLLECKKIAAMAEAYYAAVAPHCPLGPIALAACLQLDACTPNFLIQEHTTLGEGYLREPFVLDQGYVALPTKPGLGIELDEEAVAAKLYEGDWDTPRLWHEDGSVADW